MKLRDFIVENAIVADLKATTREEAILELVTALARAGAVAESAVDDICATLIKRENSGSTGFGKGIAVPHGKLTTVDTVIGTIGRSASGINFSALDGQAVYSIVLLLSPEGQPQQHLQAINLVFSSLHNDSFRRFLRQSDTPQKIVELLDEADGRQMVR
jgi:PTS system fructose-specific IIA component/PTS system nitrogen regulatory IIA component